MNKLLMEQFEDCPVIAAVKDEEGLRACLDSEIRIVFVLYGDICSISGIVGRLKDAGKTVIVHLDLISGLSGKEIAVSFIHSTTAADGIISTKPAPSCVSSPLIPWPSKTSGDNPNRYILILLKCFPA